MHDRGCNIHNGRIERTGTEHFARFPSTRASHNQGRCMQVRVVRTEGGSLQALGSPRNCIVGRGRHCEFMQQPAGERVSTLARCCVGIRGRNENRERKHKRITTSEQGRPVQIFSSALQSTDAHASTISSPIPGGCFRKKRIRQLSRN